MSVLDLLITNAQVYDGLDTEPQFVDVGIQRDRIVYLGENAAVAALETLDADSKVLCPGFLDSHGSSALSFLLPHAADHKLAQGVTTEIVGSGGFSPGPIGQLWLDSMHQETRALGLELGWRSLGQWFERVESYGLQQNLGCLVGHSTLRASVLADWQQCGEAQVAAMKQLLEQACGQGALGFSSGLDEAPGSFSTSEEVIALARVAAAHGGLYATHLRDERQGLADAIEEAIRIASEAGIPVLVNHLKVAERPNWGKLSDTIRRLEEARTQGLEIAFEVYPYDAETSRLRTYLPKECMANGVDGLAERLQRSDWRHYALQWLAYRGTDYHRMILATDSLPTRRARGLSIAEIAAQARRDPAEMVVDLALIDPEAWVTYHCLAEDDVDAAVLCNESIIASASSSFPVNAPRPIVTPHPRTYGTFTRFLERYALEGLLTFGHAVRKITSYPADLFGLPERGRIALGAYADLVLLNPNQVKEMATYENPRQLSRGTEKVWVNGGLVFDQGQVLEARPGRVLRRGT